MNAQVVLCTVDARGRTLKQSFFLASPPSAQGYFEVLGRSGGRISGAAGDDFVLALQFAELGDDFAVKKGPRKLRLPESEEPISSLAVIASGVGILPALQLARGALADPDSTVSSLQLLWVNDGKRDFVLNEEVEELQRRNGGAFAVTRVIDREVGNANTLFNAELSESLRPYEAGALGLVLAEGVVADKGRALLSNRGFPADAVVQLEPDTTA
jgi:NAD(P)H-flavin reductase